MIPKGIKTLCQPGLCRAQTLYKLTCSLLPNSSLLISHCHESFTLQHPYLMGTVDTQHGKHKTMVRAQGLFFTKATAKAACSGPCVHFGKPGQVKEETITISSSGNTSVPSPGQDTSSLTNSQLVDEPGKMTSSKLHPPHAAASTSGQDPCDELPTGSQSPLFVCSAQVQSLGIPGTSQLFSAWPFSFAGLKENTAVLSIRKGK